MISNTIDRLDALLEKHFNITLNKGGISSEFVFRIPYDSNKSKDTFDITIKNICGGLYITVIQNGKEIKIPYTSLSKFLFGLQYITEKQIIPELESFPINTKND